MIKLSVIHSLAVIDLIQSGDVQVDAVEVVDKLTSKAITNAKKALPGVEFHFHPGRIRFDPFSKAKLRSYLTLCPQSPYISVHLAPLPAYITTLALRWKRYLPEPKHEALIKTFIRRIKRLKPQFNTPFILENMPVLHPTRYRLESEPVVIRRVMTETDCPMLLDLTHARIAAEVRGIPVENYLLALPLERVVQIHVTGALRREGKLYDAHEPMEAADYNLLAWALERTQPVWLTLEYFKEDAHALRDQLVRLREFIK